MSTQKPSFLALTNAGMRASPEFVEPPRDELGGLRGQVQEIIDEVLADSSEATDAVRQQLRRHVAAHPGRPEDALLEHLSSIGTQQPGWGVADTPDPAPQVDGRDSDSSQHATTRLEAALRDRMLMTAFQPVFDLTTGAVVGAEALTRFVSDGGDPADYWFAEAEDTGLRTDLEFAALESALTAALDLPPQLFVTLKLSDAVCLDPRLPALFDQTPVAPGRVILEISGHFPADQAASLDAAVGPLRSAGMRLSIENTGSCFSAVHHIHRLKPEMIKLDPRLTAGLSQDPLRQEIVGAEVASAQEIGAVLTAQRIETSSELTTVTGLGIALGQGYHLGRPSIQPSEWATWCGRAGHFPFPVATGRAART